MSKTQTADQFALGGGPVATTTAVDPRTGAGVAAPVGSRLINPTTGQHYDRAGAAGSPNTTWKGGGISLLDASPTGTIDLYVDGAAGNDANDGLTALTAKATVGALRAAYWYQAANHQRVVVHLAGGAAGAVQTYTEDCLWIGGGEEAMWSSWRYEGPEMGQIVPTTGPATAALDAVPAVRVDQTSAPSGTGNRTRFDFTVAAPGWTVNDLVGSFLRVTRAGRKVFFELPITENSANGIIVDAVGIVGVVLATDLVEIVRPLAMVVAPPAGSSFGILTTSGNGLGSRPFANSSYPSVFTRVAFEDLWAHGVGLTFDRCLFKGSAGLGLGCQILGDAFAFSNCALWTNLFLAGNGQTTRPYSDVLAPINTTVRVSLMGAKPSTLAAASTPALLVGGYGVQTGNCTWYVSYPLSVYDSTGTANIGAINVQAMGRFIVAPGTAIGGNRNTEYGIRALGGGRARVNGGNALTTITGVKGSLAVDTGAAVAYGVGAGQFEEAVGWNGNFTRMLEGAAAAPTGQMSMITTQALVP